MVTEAQLKANRQNAKKSTGPKTAAGKAKSSQNAMTFGILSANPLLSDEDPEELSELTNNLISSFRPADQIEAALVDRIIYAIWRQRRLQKAETAQIELARLPQSLMLEVNTSMMWDPKKWRSANDLREATEDEINKTAFYKKIAEELKQCDIEAASKDVTLLESFPHLLTNLRTMASRSGKSWEEFAQDPANITSYLDSLKALTETHLENDIDKNLVRALGGIIKMSRMIPKPKLMEQLMKYQVQLDNDLYKALDALRKQQQYRLKTIEGEIVKDE